MLVLVLLYVESGFDREFVHLPTYYDVINITDAMMSVGLWGYCLGFLLGMNTFFYPLLIIGFSTQYK